MAKLIQSLSVYSEKKSKLYKRIRKAEKWFFFATMICALPAFIKNESVLKSAIIQDVLSYGYMPLAFSFILLSSSRLFIKCRKKIGKINLYVEGVKIITKDESISIPISEISELTLIKNEGYHESIKRPPFNTYMEFTDSMIKISTNETAVFYVDYQNDVSKVYRILKQNYNCTVSKSIIK